MRVVKPISMNFDFSLDRVHSAVKVLLFKIGSPIGVEIGHLFQSA